MGEQPETDRPEAYACTLDEERARARLPQAHALAVRLRSRQRDARRLVLRFVDDGRTPTLIEEFVRDEQQCCAFFGFAVRREADEVALELSAPAGAEHMLDAAMEAFDPELGDGERLALQRRHARST